MPTRQSSTQKACITRPSYRNRPTRSAAVQAMGLQFPNPVGLAAGFDRTGDRAPSLLAFGFGHIEIGTLNSATELAAPHRHSDKGALLGLNIGSMRPGLDDPVIEDFEMRLRQTAHIADYVVANLTAPTMNRNGNTPGVERLIQRLSNVRDELEKASRRRLPLLVKIDGGAQGEPIPSAAIAARLHGLDGIVLVSDCLRRLEEMRNYTRPLTLMSVGGIRTAADVRARLAAGAALVQIHRAFADGGHDLLLRILEDL